MINQARGSFTVAMTPQPHVDGIGDPAIGRMSIAKQFAGDLSGTSHGQMLAAMSEVKGSAGYVAIERVDGTLNGRTGTVTLQHTGMMTRGTPQLTITVVPDSGTGQLVGISGT
jgi:Flp pilus assembly protein TadG